MNVRSYDVESLFKQTGIALKSLLGSLSHRIHFILIDQDLQSAVTNAIRVSKLKTGRATMLMRDVELNDGTNAVVAILNSNYEN